MNDKYLWDRSGEPDSRVQELEEILSTLRYQPRPLEIPSHIRIGRQRTLFPALAIAAAIALVTMGFGLWFHFREQRAPQPFTATHEPRRAIQPPLISPNNQPEVAGIDKPSIQKRNRDHERARKLLAGSRSARATPKIPELTAQELAEKEQVLLALRLASAKLNLAQRKTLGAPQPNTIRNQHKMG